ncbi:hypothetical protein N9H21_02065 [bacterium]|nr:hypothetical protein [bacterium]MDB4431150.1 hypothetical protein [Pseudomonadales bacterium]
MSKLNYLLPVLLATFVSTPASYAFTLSISGDDGNPGEMVKNSECAQSGEASFTSDSSGTFYSNQQSTNWFISLSVRPNEDALLYVQSIIDSFIIGPIRAV